MEEFSRKSGNLKSRRYRSKFLRLQVVGREKVSRKSPWKERKVCSFRYRRCRCYMKMLFPFHKRSMSMKREFIKFVELKLKLINNRNRDYLMFNSNSWSRESFLTCLTLICWSWHWTTFPLATQFRVKVDRPERSEAEVTTFPFSMTQNNKSLSVRRFLVVIWLLTFEMLSLVSKFIEVKCFPFFLEIFSFLHHKRRRKCYRKENLSKVA